MKTRRVIFCFLFFFVYAVIFRASSVAQEKASPHYPLSSVIEIVQKKNCSGEFGFAVFADTHVNETVFPFMLTLADKLAPAFIMDAGDFTNNGLDAEYALLISQAAKIQTPFLVSPGNHEYRNNQGHTSGAKKKKYVKIFGLTDYSFEYCGWTFISVDVVAMDMVTPQQLSWLEGILKNLKDGKAAVFMHYPPGNLPKWKEYHGSFFKTNADAFTRLVEKYKVRYVFAGHFHIYDRIKSGETTYIQVGAGGGSPETDYTGTWNSPDAGGYYGFVYVHVNGNESVDVVVRPKIPENKENK